jgi:hypothetical protein
MYRHIKHTCKVKKEQDLKNNTLESKLLELIDNNKSLQNDNKILRDELNELKDLISNSLITGNTTNINNNNTTNNTNSNNTNSNNKTINNNININITAHGKEKYDDVLNKDELMKILRRGFSSVTDLIERTHFNPDRPQFHNIFIANLTNTYLLLFNGKNWIVDDKMDTIETLFENGRYYLAIKHEDFKETISERDIRGNKTLDLFEKFHTEIDDLPLKRNEILQDIKKMMYNSRDIVINTKKKLSHKI